MRFVRSLLAVAAVAVTPPTFASAATRPSLVEVDVASSSSGTTFTPLRFTLSLPDSGCASAKVNQADRFVELQVCRGAGSNAVGFEFSESVTNGKVVTKRQASVQAVLEPGKRVPIGKVTSGNAPVLELAAEMK